MAILSSRRPWLARALALSLLLVLAAGLVGGCTSAKADASQGGHALAMAPMSGMTDEIRSAPATVSQSYQFAVANPDTLKQIPCYCGCGAAGHTSNYSCYVKDVDASGKITFDQHALGCSICVDITQDTMRLLKEGKSVPEIKSIIDNTYAKYGPSNIP